MKLVMGASNPFNHPPTHPTPTHSHPNLGNTHSSPHTSTPPTSLSASHVKLLGPEFELRGYTDLYDGKNGKFYALPYGAESLLGVDLAMRSVRLLGDCAKVFFFPNRSLLLRVLITVQKEGGYRDTRGKAVSTAVRPGIAVAVFSLHSVFRHQCFRSNGNPILGTLTFWLPWGLHSVFRH